MSDFDVQPAALRTASADARGAADELCAELRRLRREVDAVVGAHWRGRAATAFDRSWAAWDEGAREVIAALRWLADAVNDTALAYTTGDASAACDLARARG